MVVKGTSSPGTYEALSITKVTGINLTCHL
jgi:hypothetical protein